jgi:hypothetical protein
MARMFGTERIPAAGVMGKQQKDAADFETPLFAAQVKKGYKQPSYLREWMDGIVASAGDKLPVVIWSENRGHDKDALVFLRAQDFANLTQPRLELAQDIQDNALMLLSHHDRSVRSLALFVSQLADTVDPAKPKLLISK